MREVNIESLDLNLLLLLDRLLTERHVTRAATSLNMSQPALSRALARLRVIFNDPLLVRTAQGYDLSARAKQIQPELGEILIALESLIQQPVFNPAADKGLIKVTGLDLELALYLPQLMQRMRENAPGMHLEIVKQEDDSFAMLDRNDVHFSLSGLEPSASTGTLHRIQLDKMSAVCLMSCNHPLADQPLTPDNYANAAHGLVSITGRGPGYMDRVLEKIGRQREVILRLSSFMAVADFCETTDLVFTLPQRLAERIAAGRRLCLRRLPAELQQPPVKFYFYWHTRHHHDPRMIWIRQQLVEIAQALPGFKPV